MTLSHRAKLGLKRAFHIATNVFVVLVVLLAILLVGFRLLGFQIYAVLSGSMEPDIPVGALVYVKGVDPQELEVGDDISYLLSENTVVTHRIVEIVPDQEDPSVLRFQTKGIANEVADQQLVHYKNIIGKVSFHLPLLGYVSGFIQSTPGRYITMIVGSVLILVTFLPDIISGLFFAKKEQTEESVSEDQDADPENPQTHS